MDRFWVGGAGTWNTVSTANWSASSGGPNGASVPTVADSVFFDQAGTYTVTMTGALACLDITVSAGTVTFADGTSPTLQVRGSMTLLAGTVWSSVGGITFTSTTTGRTITTNGVSFPSSSIGFSGIGGFWTLGSALTATNATLSISFGTLDTSSVGNYAVTCSTFSGGGVNARTVNFNNSTITCTGNSSNAINLGVITNLTFNAGTSQINLTGSTSGINSGGLTFYNVAFTNTTAATKTINGTNTFNNLAVTAPSSAGVTTVTFAAQQTINGTLSTTGTAGNRRVFFTSFIYGISVDLVVNSAPSLTDADFRGLYVRGTAAPISGTRIGNRGECRGITFSTPKTVYWNRAAGGNWTDTAWALSVGGGVSDDNFPLPQDIATFVNTGLNTSATVATRASVPVLGTIDMSARTNAMTFTVAQAAQTCYGNWINGSGTTISDGNTLTFAGGTTQTITSAGKTFTTPIVIDTYGGTVQLADALNIGTRTLTVTNGTFNTAGYNVTLGAFSSSNTNVRTINWGSSTISSSNVSPPLSINSTNLAFNAGTSTFLSSSGSSNILVTGGLTFYNLTFNSSASQPLIQGNNTFNDLTINAPSGAGLNQCTFSSDQTINGTLTCAGATAVRRIFLRSDTIGTPRTLTVNSISATDCDFRNINLAGAASGASPTRAGDCGGNTGITFPAPKTVYWNLAGAQDWSATAWASGSGGTPAVNNFPLAQDTAVFDNAGSVTGTITIQRAWNIGTMDASNRTSAMTLFQVITTADFSIVYGDWKFGTGVTLASTSGTINFAKNGTQTITSNGVQFGCNVNINHPLANVQLADALSLGATRGLSLSQGTFDAVTYNVTTGIVQNLAGANTLRMGSGTWTITGVGTIWAFATPPTLIASTSTIVLSDTSASARTFQGGGLYYNKLTIGGTTGTSTLTITGNNTFGELASTKTVAHTIAFGTTVQTFGAWTVTGTAGNVVTITGTSTTNVIAGPAVTGVDYLAMGTWGVSTTSPGEFYAGANSTGTAAAPVFRTAAPTPRNLYWVNGTGNWSSTTKWATSSGGTPGAAIPTSLDTVTFDSLSNAIAYTATIDAGVTLARCASFTMAGPLVGNVTFAGSVGIAFHGNVSFAATGITRTYSGAMNLAGNSSYTFTPNGVGFTASTVMTVIGVGATWTLGGAVSQVQFAISAGSFSSNGYSLSVVGFAGNNVNVYSLSLGSSTITLGGGDINLTGVNGNLNSGTSTFLFSGGNSILGGGKTYHNITWNPLGNSTYSISGVNTFNNMTINGSSNIGINTFLFSNNQTIGTLTLNGGATAAYRNFLNSNTIGTTRTLTVGTLTAGAADIDFRDITIAGAAAPISGTRFGDAKGNSGITFPAAKTVYWALATSNNWGNTGAGSWSATSGGSAAADQFPLAQDTAYIPFAVPNNNQTITVNANYNVGTFDMNERNGSALVTLSMGSNTLAIYGNWINGTGTTHAAGNQITFAGRGSQTITSAGRTFTQFFVINSPGGSVTLQDAFVNSNPGTFGLTLNNGTFDANGYNFTLSGSLAGINLVPANSGVRVLAIGAGTWTLAGSVGLTAAGATNLTVTGTGTISFTSASAKLFAGGNVNYSNITLNQGGAGTLTISGNNTFKDITNTYSATGATSILLGATTQTLTSPWTATGEAGRVLTVSGSPANLIFSGGGQAANVDYLAINNVRAYNLTDTWYAGANSTNGGSLGWYFVAAGGTVYAVTITETGTGTDSITARVTLLGTISETGTGTDTVSSSFLFVGSVNETSTITDSNFAAFQPKANITETATGSDVESAILAAIGLINETATGTDTDSALMTAQSSVNETAAGTDADSASLSANSNISETATAADAVSALRVLLASVSEAATATDLISAIKGLFAFIVESASITDALNAPGSTYNPSLSETATAADSISALALFASQVSESASITDLAAAFQAYLVAVLEAASGADNASAAATFQSQVTETSAAQDIVRGFMVAAVQVSESATGTDQVSALRALAAAVVETVSGSDVVSASAVFQGILQEIATLTDSVNAPGSTYSAPVVELATLQDAVRAAATFPTAVTEAATGTETNSAAFTPLVRIIETATVTDVTSALAAFAARTAESANITDAVSPPGSIYNPVVLAVAQLLDQVSPAGSVYNAPVLESATIADSLIGGFLWNLIDNIENADWGDISNIQAVSWIGVADNQTPNWQNVGNTQGTGWTQINTDDDPSWQPILPP